MFVGLTEQTAVAEEAEHDRHASLQPACDPILAHQIKDMDVIELVVLQLL